MLSSSFNISVIFIFLFIIYIKMTEILNEEDNIIKEINSYKNLVK
jgi:hypothetical protein